MDRRAIEEHLAKILGERIDVQQQRRQRKISKADWLAREAEFNHRIDAIANQHPQIFLQISDASSASDTLSEHWK